MSANKTRALGRGLDNLIPMDVDVRELSVAEAGHKVVDVDVEKIRPNRSQPRVEFNAEDLENLSNSIKNHGVLQPLLVTKEGDGFELVAGERRLRASINAGLEKVPVLITNADELRRVEIALIENVQRENLQPLELAASFHHLHSDFGLDYEEIGKRVGKASTTIVNIVRLIYLPDEAKQALRQKRITEGHARTILSLKDHSDKQAELLDLIIKFDWSVRKAEQFVVAFKKGAKTSAQAIKNTRIITPETKQLGKKLGTEVTIKRMARGGQLMIAYKDDSQLSNIMNRLEESL